MIRHATFADLDALLGLCRAMHSESRYACLHWADDLMGVTLANLITSEHGLALVAESDGEIVGFMLAGISAQWFTYDLITFEYGAYVIPARRGSVVGVRLLSGYRDWARSIGAKYITAGVTAGINDERAGRIYGRIGLDPVGTVYALEG